MSARSAVEPWEKWAAIKKPEGAMLSDIEIDALCVGPERKT
jgi:hypothetical protein